MAFGFACALIIGRAHAAQPSDQPSPLVIVDPDPPESEIANDPPPPEVESPAPADPADWEHHAEWLGAISMAPLGLLTFGSNVGTYRSRYVGVSLLSTVGHIAYLPDGSGLLVDIRWQLNLVEGPLAMYRSTLEVATGYREHLGGHHALYAKAGMNGVGGAALKWWRAEFRMPHAGLGYLWHASDNLFQLGPEAALAMIGAFNVGHAVQLSLDDESSKDYYGVSYTFRPYLAARADLQLSPVAVTVSCGRTYLAGGLAGDRLDDAKLTVCGSIDSEEFFPFGGCVFTEVLWGDFRRKEPFEGPLTTGVGWYVGASIALATVGEL